MGKELPYFKFNAKAWLTGDICKKNKAVKGVFIDVISYYWDRDCIVSVDKLKDWFEADIDEINTLIKAEIIKIDSDKNVIIEFLIEQLDELKGIKKTNAENGKKGGRPPKKITQNKPTAFISETEINPTVIFHKPKETNIDIEVERDIDKERDYSNNNTVGFEKSEHIPKPNPLGFYRDVIDVGSVMKSNNEKNWRDTICLINRISEENILVFVDRFTQHCVASGKDYTSIGPFKEHFNNWVKKQDTHSNIISSPGVTTLPETPTERRNRERAEKQQQQQ